MSPDRRRALVGPQRRLTMPVVTAVASSRGVIALELALERRHLCTAMREVRMAGSRAVACAVRGRRRCPASLILACADQR